MAFFWTFQSGCDGEKCKIQSKTAELVGCVDFGGEIGTRKAKLLKNGIYLLLNMGIFHGDRIKKKNGRY